MSENPPNALRQKLLQSLRLAVAPMCPVTFCIAPYPKSEIPAALVNVDSLRPGVGLHLVAFFNLQVFQNAERDSLPKHLDRS